MPRKETLYYCDICNKSFKEKQNAIKCEKSHFKVKYIDQVEYSQFDNKSKYPESVLVLLENDNGVETKIRYYRK